MSNELMVTGVEALYHMLAWRRSAGTKTERKFINRFLAPLEMEVDDYGNLFKKIGDVPIMWSCHTDTVHHRGGHQKVNVRGSRFVLPKGSDSNCLGADDTAGVWMMREMILAKKPGLYIFHREEEIGGRGSYHIAEKQPDLIAGIQCAVAFDRRGKTDIITHQGSGRCCSDDFANSLADQISMAYEPSSRGIFTDTANYTNLIGECTNVSVGYQFEHTSKEELDFVHADALLKKVLLIEPESLVISRKPGERDPNARVYGYGNVTDFDSYCGKYSGYGASIRDSQKDGKKVYTNLDKVWDELAEYDDVPVIDTGGPSFVAAKGYNFSKWDIRDMVYDHPDEVADYLERFDVDANELASHIEEMGGQIRMPFRRKIHSR